MSSLGGPTLKKRANSINLRSKINLGFYCYEKYPPNKRSGKGNILQRMVSTCQLLIVYQQKLVK